MVQTLIVKMVKFTRMDHKEAFKFGEEGSTIYILRILIY